VRHIWSFLKRKTYNYRLESINARVADLETLTSLQSDILRVRKMRINMKLDVDLAGLERTEGVHGDWFNIGGIKL